MLIPGKLVYIYQVLYGGTMSLEMLVNASRRAFITQS